MRSVLLQFNVLSILFEINCLRHIITFVLYIVYALFAFKYILTDKITLGKTEWRVRVMIMGFHATFNNISVISWRSVLLEEEHGVPGETHRALASH